MKSLSIDQKKVVSAVSLNARASVPALAKTVQMREPKVRRILQVLQDRKVLVPLPLINVHALGYTDHCLFLRFEPGKRGSRERLMKFLLTSNRSAWVAELAGEHSLSVSLFAKNISEVDQFLLACRESAGGGIVQKSFAVREQWTLFQYKYAEHATTNPGVLTRKSNVPILEIDDLDSKVLSRLSQFPGESSSAAARALKIPATTYLYRLQQLEHRKIVVGYVYHLNANAVPLHSFRILVYSRAVEPSLREELFAYARMHPYISAYVHCVGEWDFELNVEVPESPMLSVITSDLEERFGSRIQALKTLTVLEVKKAQLYPF